MEDYYIDVIKKQQFKVKMSYVLRGFVLIFVIFVQTNIFLRLIDRKLKEVKDIVLGPN